MDVRSQPQDTEWLSRLVACNRERSVSEEAFCPAAYAPKPFAFSRKVKRRGVVNDSDKSVTAYPLVRSLDVTFEQARHRHLRVHEEAVQRFPIGDGICSGKLSLGDAAVSSTIRFNRPSRR
jgi:hypothetical protein